jgi:hypothetical protein
VVWLPEPISAGGTDHPTGTFFVSAASGVRGDLESAARELGVSFTGVNSRPTGRALELSKPRIGLWDRYGGSMPSGWIRFIFERFGFDYDVVFPQEMDAGGLAEKYDVLIFPDGAIPRAGGPAGRYGRGAPPNREEIPEEYWDRLGSVTPDTTVGQLRAFLEEGGTIVALESSTGLGYHLGLPIQDFLVDEAGNPLRPEEFFVPGSLLEVKVDSSSPVTHGLPEDLIVNFARSPVFSVDPEAAGVQTLATYASDAPLRSGWAWGQEKLEGGAAMLEANVGEGTLYLFGPQVTYRGQTHETFPLLFNGILLSASREITIR